MNRLSDRLKGAKLTPQQRRIADYFFKNQERIGNMSSMDVAKEIGVSDASIIRFARAIGYLGFTDLKNDIYNSLNCESQQSCKVAGYPYTSSESRHIFPPGSDDHIS